MKTILVMTLTLLSQTLPAGASPQRTRNGTIPLLRLEHPRGMMATSESWVTVRSDGRVVAGHLIYPGTRANSSRRPIVKERALSKLDAATLERVEACVFFVLPNNDFVDDMKGCQDDGGSQYYGALGRDEFGSTYCDHEETLDDACAKEMRALLDRYDEQVEW